ncbi:hypothetical protein [Gemmatimonas groenlandica]|uniref:Uncharacterized protein n=1 Tax=Gemmatimonas groenlandica TaxID=2732249 RepID=A0A6M4ILI7_9BACT|nr:hypothetical protein [Gemmatimonas groenlandica]QJR35874.1 hypothetical protein HKW67_10305 [Gemmatimonas groenlandica]
MHQQSNRQLQERLTSLSIADVLARAARFFTRRSGVYATFIEKQGPSHLVLRGQGGEELVIAARVTDAGTSVSGSTYMFDQQLARFLDSLPTAPAVSVATPDAAAVAALPHGVS